jgi:cell division protein FtsQ
VGGRPSIDPRIRQRRLAIQRSRGRRRLHWIGGALVALAVAAGAVVLLHSSWFSAEVVSVSGVHPHTSDAAIVAAAGLEHHPPLVSVDPGATADRVEALPFIATAQVHRHWPDGVAISVTERVPAMTMAGPGTSWSVLDGDGRTLEVGATRPLGLVLLVVHAAGGTLAPAAVGGTLVPDGSVGLTVCRTLPPAFSAQVTTVTVAPDGTVSLALNSGITILLGTDNDLHAKFEDVAAIIAHASLRGATTIDVTVPQSPTVAG